MSQRLRHFTLLRQICLLAGVAFCLLFQPLALCQQPFSAAQKDSLQSIRAQINIVSLAESEKALLQYLQGHPASAEAHFLLGYIFFREQRPKHSLAEFTEGAKYHRPAANDLKIVASDYILLGDFADGDKWLSVVTQEAPKDAEAWYLLGRTKYNENRFTEAIACFEQTLALRPNDVKAEDNLGLSYQGLNQLDKATTAFETAVAWQKNAVIKNVQPFLNLGTLLTDQGQPQVALVYLEQAAASAPHNPKAHEELGRTYFILQLTDKAQHELERAVTLAPNAADLHFMLGRIYRRQRGMQRQAKEQFDICAKLNNSHSSIETPNPASQN